MENAAAVVGYIVLVCVAVAIACGSAATLFSKVTEWHQNLVDRGVTRFMLERGRQMECQSHWFRTPADRAMWKACARAVSSPTYPDPADIRDRVVPELIAAEAEADRATQVKRWPISSDPATQLQAAAIIAGAAGGKAQS